MAYIVGNSIPIEQRWKQGPPTDTEVLAFPSRVELVDAANALRIGREMAHEMAQKPNGPRGSFPIPLIKIGRSWFANKSALLQELGLAAPARGEVA